MDEVQEQPFQVLMMLVGRPSEVVTREELRQQLWPADTFVDFDHSLNTVINKLREALNDSAANPRFIETLARRGYRFLAPVEFVEKHFTPTTIVAPVEISNASASAEPSQSVSVLTRPEDVPAVRRQYVRVPPQIGLGLALAATAALIYVPFAQRTLLLMGDRPQNPRRAL